MTLGYFAASLGLLPVVALLVRRTSGLRWWLMGAAFAVSFLADMASLWATHPYVAALYPALQAGVFLLALLPLTEVPLAVAVILGAASASLVWSGATGLDVLARTVAFGMVAGAGFRHSGWLRWSLLMGFGGGLLAWWGYVLAPGWWSWGALQAVRVVAIACWGVALWRSPK